MGGTYQLSLTPIRPSMEMGMGNHKYVTFILITLKMEETRGKDRTKHIYRIFWLAPLNYIDTSVYLTFK